MKRTFHIITLICLLITLVSTQASAYDFSAQNSAGVTIYYNYINGGTEVEVTYGDGVGKYSGLGTLTIPDKVSYGGKTMNVTRIGKSALYYSTGLTSVTIGNNVTVIDDYALYWCTGLASVTIPNGVTTIGEDAFRYTALTSINLPNSVKSIGALSFQGCSSLTTIKIGTGLASIGEDAFGWCKNLNTIQVASGNPNFDSRNNCNALIETGPAKLVLGCTNSTIPDGVKIIGKRAFKDCNNLSSVTLPSSLTTIEDGAFEACWHVAEITIPKSVTSIGKGPFRGCAFMESIKVASGNTKYDSRNNCNAIIEKATKTLIQGCSKSFIPEGVTAIADYAFSGMGSLTSITIPETVTYIGHEAFASCSSLTSIALPNSLKSMGNYVFESCYELRLATIGSGLSTIGIGAFTSCESLTSIVIPNTVTTVARGAFSNTGLTSVTIPVSVRFIDDMAFQTETLKTVVSENYNPFAIVDDVFSEETLTNGTLYVPTGMRGRYKETEGWSAFKTIKEKTINIVTDISGTRAASESIRAEGGLIVVEGLKEGAEVSVYDAGGRLLGSCLAKGSLASVRTSLHAGSMAVVKIGGKAVKVVMR